MELTFKPDTPILACPHAGWSTLDFGRCYGNISYLQNGAKDLLKWILCYLDNHEAVVSFDEEGSEFLVILTPYVTYVITERHDTRFYRFEIDAEKLYNKIIKDITDHLDEWAGFDVMTDTKEDFDTEKESNKKELNHLLTSIFNHLNYRKGE